MNPFWRYRTLIWSLQRGERDPQNRNNYSIQTKLKVLGLEKNKWQRREGDKKHVIYSGIKMSWKCANAQFSSLSFWKRTERDRIEVARFRSLRSRESVYFFLLLENRSKYCLICFSLQNKRLVFRLEIFWRLSPFVTMWVTAEAATGLTTSLFFLEPPFLVKRNKQMFLAFWGGKLGKEEETDVRQHKLRCLQRLIRFESYDSRKKFHIFSLI